MKSPHRRAERSLLLAAVALLTAAPHAGAFGYDPVGRRFDPVRPHQTTPPPSQQPPPPPSQPSADQPPDGPPPPRGKVLFQSHGDPPTPSETPAPEPEGLDAQPQASKPDAQPQLTDADRAAIRITAFDLDLRLHPATSGVNARARLTLTNTAGKPLPRIALQISSTLRWGSASLVGAGHPSSPLPVVQHKLDTDADHTGQTSELILTLPSPLAPGASLALQLFYAGTVAPSAGRLQRLGASSSQALATDWDAVSPEASSLRGLGNILWFPAAIPQLFLSDGTLVPAVAKARLDHASTPIHLHLSVEYTGEPPVAAYFCGRRQPLQPLTDDAESPIAYGSGIATADFPSEPIGIRPLSLFVVAQPEALIAPLPAPLSKPSVGPNARSTPAVAPGNGPDAATAMLAVESTDDRALPPFAASAQRIAPLLQDWLGSRPLSALTVLDHTGQPFEDGPLLVAPVASLAGSTAAPALAHSLTHAWVQTGQPWMDEGLAEFISLLWTEHEHGRDAALAQLGNLLQPLAAAESTPESAPDSSPGSSPDSPPNSQPTEPASAPSANPAEAAGSSTSASASASAPTSFGAGQPLVAASDEVFFRRKAAAVWWMLRELAGEQPLQLALSAWRTQPVRPDTPAAQARAFQALLEKTSGKDLGWFFDSWVLEDRGLPDLSIVEVTPRQLPAGQGHDTGWLVAVTVRNSGAATADVPLSIRSGPLTTNKRIRVPGLSSVTNREVLRSAPTEIVLNDGSTPEAGAAVHTRSVVVRSE